MEYLVYIMVGIICVFGVLGYSKGLSKTIIDLLALVLSITGAYVISPILNKIILTTDFFDQLVLSVGASLNFEEMADNGQRSFIEGFGLPEAVNNYLLSNNNPDFYSLFNINSIEEYIAFVIANIFVSIFSFIVAIIIIRICIGVLRLVFGIFRNLPVIKTFDKLGGFIIGIFMGFIIAGILMLIIPLIFLETNEYAMYLNTIHNSKILSFIYSKNFFINFILN